MSLIHTSLKIDSLDRQHLLETLCETLANGHESSADTALCELKKLLNKSSDDCASTAVEILNTQTNIGLDVNELGSRGLRAVDVLCRGRDSDESCFAVMALIQSGADTTDQPNPSEAAPLHSAAYYGNWRLLGTLLDLGVDAQGLSSGISQKLIGSTAIHALATGFRSSRAENFAECFSALLASGCNVDAKDRKRQSAIDIAMRTAVATGDETLTDAMLNYGVTLDGTSELSAQSVAHALARKTGNVEIISKISASSFETIARSIDALRALPKNNLNSESPSPRM